MEEESESAADPFPDPSDPKNVDPRNIFWINKQTYKFNSPAIF